MVCSLVEVLETYSRSVALYAIGLTSGTGYRIPFIGHLDQKHQFCCALTIKSLMCTHDFIRGARPRIAEEDAESWKC